MLSILHALGSNEISSFGDSTARFDLTDPSAAPGQKHREARLFRALPIER